MTATPRTQSASDFPAIAPAGPHVRRVFLAATALAFAASVWAPGAGLMALAAAAGAVATTLICRTLRPAVRGRWLWLACVYGVALLVAAPALVLWHDIGPGGVWIVSAAIAIAGVRQLKPV